MTAEYESLYQPHVPVPTCDHAHVKSRRHRKSVFFNPGMREGDSHWSGASFAVITRRDQVRAPGGEPGTILEFEVRIFRGATRGWLLVVQADAC